MTGRYTTAASLRQAIDDRIRAEAQATGRDPNWLRRRLVFCRALARLFKAAPQTWVLKGGLAVEVRRPGLARATRDVDLIMRPGLVSDPTDGEEVREALTDALAEDPDGDRLEFRVGRVSRLQDDAYGRPAWRFSVTAELAGRRMADMVLDVVARAEEIGGVEARPLPDVLGFTGIPSPMVTVADMRQQYAEKLHASLAPMRAAGRAAQRTWWTSYCWSKTVSSPTPHSSRAYGTYSRYAGPTTCRRSFPGRPRSGTLPTPGSPRRSVSA